MSSRRVLLLSPPQDRKYYISVQPPLGILYLAAYLREKGIPVEVMDLKVIPGWEKALKAKLKEFSPEIVGISSNVFNRLSSLALAKLLKSLDSRLTVVAGGPQPTSSPEEYLGGDVDFVIPYEGEKVFHEFVTAEDFDAVTGAVPCGAADFRERFARVKPDPVLDLDSLPFPAYDLLEVSRYHINSYRKKPIVSVITSRGCPAACIFCNLQVSGKKWRARSAENVVRELLWLQNELGVKEVSIEDDNFTLKLDRVSEICRQMRSRGVTLAWQLANGIRADRMSRELLREMKDAGCWKLAIAPEVGDEKSRALIRKGIASEKFLDVARWCKELGIVYYAFFIMGFPFETREMAQKTIDYAIELDPLFMDLSKLRPFKGTAVYGMYSEQEQKEHDGKQHYYLNADRSWVDELYMKAYLRFYLRPAKILEIVRRIGIVCFLRLVRYGFDVLVIPKLFPWRKHALAD